jgi:hypothetical protein
LLMQGISLRSVIQTNENLTIIISKKYSDIFD